MKIIIIRHGEPDNPNQTLTKKGFKEAKALSKFYKDLEFDQVYSSPLPRAKLTCEEFMKNHPHQSFEVKDWLKEFTHYVNVPYSDKKVQNWDFLPEYFVAQKDLYDNDKYLDTELMKSGDVKNSYNEVIASFDNILKANGYVRENGFYRVTESNRKTLIFFCHFGMMSVIMSHLMNIPYVVLTQTFCCPPTGVTILTTEERINSIAQFRCSQYGDITHLNLTKQKPSFHGRFCETFDSDERH